MSSPCLSYTVYAPDKPDKADYSMSTHKGNVYYKSKCRHIDIYQTWLLDIVQWISVHGYWTLAVAFFLWSCIIRTETVKMSRNHKDI